MIWVKTEAGRREIQTRALVRQRPARNLLVLIDGRKSDDALLAELTGIGADAFRELEALGLITPLGGQVPTTAPSPTSAAAPATPPADATAAASTATAASAAAAPATLDYAQFTAALTKIIASELGLRGFMLTLAVEKAGSAEELQDVARRTLEQVRARKGDAAASASQRALYGD